MLESEVASAGEMVDQPSRGADQDVDLARTALQTAEYKKSSKRHEKNDIKKQRTP